LSTGARPMTHAERIQRVEPHHPELPVTRRCELLAVARFTVYDYRAQDATDAQALHAPAGRGFGGAVGI